MSVERFLPFVVLLAACTWNSGGVDRTGGGQGVPCEEASDGNSCVKDGERCFAGADECTSAERVCRGGTWTVETTGLACPTTLPPAGSVCEPQIAICEGACPYSDVVALCDGSWTHVTLSDCTVHQNESECAADAYCQWNRDCATMAERCLPAMPCGYGCAPGLTCRELALAVSDGSCDDPIPSMLCMP